MLERPSGQMSRSQRGVGSRGAGSVAWAPGLTKRRSPRRAVHLIDIENLAGYPVPSLAMVRQLRACYTSRVGFGPIDQVIIACNHLAIGQAMFGWPRARYLIRSGKNGADTELINVIAYEDIAVRFSRVVIASGDGIFSGEAAALGALGCHVTVVSRRAALSKRLQRVAHRLIYIDGPEGQPAPAPAAGPDLPAVA